MTSKLRPAASPPKGKVERFYEGKVAGFQSLAVFKRHHEAREPITDFIVVCPQFASLDSAVDAMPSGAKVGGQPENLPSQAQNTAPGDLSLVRIRNSENHAVVHPCPGTDRAESLGSGEQVSPLFFQCFWHEGRIAETILPCEPPRQWQNFILLNLEWTVPLSCHPCRFPPRLSTLRKTCLEDPFQNPSVGTPGSPGEVPSPFRRSKDPRASLCCSRRDASPCTMKSARLFPTEPELALSRNLSAHHGPALDCQSARKAWVRVDFLRQSSSRFHADISRAGT